MKWAMSDASARERSTKLRSLNFATIFVRVLREEIQEADQL
jgi:hypothetical protein